MPDAELHEPRECFDSWSELIVEATRFRRELHAAPELTWQEHETARRVRERLDAAGISWRACAETGTVAELAESASGPRIALRGDLDALPIHEQGESEWRSQSEGCMHACGHDGHTAALLASAWWLKQHEDALPGPVRLLFQPAEEGGHGARAMIKGGALEGVDAVYGWHNWPAIPFGKAVCPDGTVMAANGTFKITVEGLGGHASQPELCRDPVFAGAAIITALQQLVARRLPPQAANVVAVTWFKAESADTVTPQSATLGGSIRLADNRFREQVTELITEIAGSTAQASGCEATVEHSPRYDATVNDAKAAETMRGALAEVLGEDWLSRETAVPIMASEDFSEYQKRVPGAFALIGADDGPEHRVACHNARYDFNDALLPRVVALYARLAGAPPPELDGDG